VYPLNLNSSETIEFLANRRLKIPPDAKYIYHVRRFEVDQKLIEQDIWLCELDLQAKVSYIAFGDEDLHQILHSLELSVSDLLPPYRCDYPI
jgi:hypothetical protein